MHSPTIYWYDWFMGFDWFFVVNRIKSWLYIDVGAINQSQSRAAYVRVTFNEKLIIICQSSNSNTRFTCQHTSLSRLCCDQKHVRKFHGQPKKPWLFAPTTDRSVTTHTHIIIYYRHMDDFSSNACSLLCQVYEINVVNPSRWSCLYWDKSSSNLMLFISFHWFCKLIPLLTVAYRICNLRYTQYTGFL